MRKVLFFQTSKNRFFLFLFLGLLCPQLLSPVIAQTNKAILKLEDIYKNDTYRDKSYGPIRWSKDNKGYLTFETNKAVNGRDIVKYDAETGTRTVVCNAKSFIPEGQSEPLTVSDYIWSSDNSKLLIFTNTRRVWRYNTRGDYWVLDIRSGKLRQLGKSVEPTTMMFAKFSPDGTRVAYVSKLNIYVEELETGKVTPITLDGGGNIVNGTFDWVYEEELDCRDGFRWSPDGKKIAYWQSDTKGIGTFYMINNVDSIYSKVIPFPYPKVGTANSAVKIGVVSAEGGITKWFELPGDPQNNYLARMDFIPNSDEVMIQQLNREQNTNRVWFGNTTNMMLSNILTDKDKAFLDIHDNIQWLDQEKYFTWTSERDGWLRLYLVSRDGKTFNPIIKENLDVVSISCIDGKGGFVYYIASPENFTQRYLYRSRLDGKGVAEKVTPASMTGHNSYQISGDARWAIHTFNNAVTPPKISLVSLPKHQIVRLLEDNATAKQKFDELGLNPKEFFKVDIGEVVLDAWMIKPVGFDPAKKYPVIFYVYGEPASTTVQDSWGGGDLWHQYLAQLGYIVVSVDNRGTKVPRGAEFRKCIYRQIGILASADQAKATQKIVSMFNYVDSKRIGIWGWSGGGQMTLNCLFRYPEIYNTGIAVSFVSDQRLYDNIYQERYMGLLEDNREGYRDGSPINFAKNLKGNLMIIHGTADDNVHYQSFEMLVNELIKNNKMFSMMSYPMRSHGINERENTSLHLRETMVKFWKSNL
ncbi:MAG: DPP IV N-terminal domain-containing protein [Mariniphaga sp.]